MKISQEMANLIQKSDAQLRHYFDIKVGFTWEIYGSFIRDNDDFVVYYKIENIPDKIEDGSELWDCPHIPYLVEHNQFCRESEGFMVKEEYPLDQINDNITDLLINLNQWIKNSKIKIYEPIQFNNLIIEFDGISKYGITEHRLNSTRGYSACLKQLPQNVQEFILNQKLVNLILD